MYWATHGVGVGVLVGEGLAVAEGVGVGLAVGVAPCTKLTKTSCCEVPLMIFRPSVQPPIIVVPRELW
ncbi:MAG: hypothetical protein DME94_11520 [Verrucomicrobia bacterium]|nr:MAG: hypothetical protein DME94_11520 [Verrucomicrobiota bacterium]